MKPFKAFQIAIAAVCIFIPLILRRFDKDKAFARELSMEGFNSIKNRDVNIRIDPISRRSKNRTEDNFIVTAHPVSASSSAVPILAFKKLQKDERCFRESISHYALSSNSYLFGFLYTMAAMMFIYNGVVHLKMRMNPVQDSETNELQLKSSEPIYNIVIGASLILVIFNPLDTRPKLHVVSSVLFFVANLLMITFCPNKYESKLPLQVRITLMIVFVAVLIFLARKKVLSVLDIEWITLTFIAAHLILIALEVHDQIKERKINYDA